MQKLPVQASPLQTQKAYKVRQFLASEEKSPYLVAQAVWFTDNHALNRLITPLREEIVRGGKRS